MADAEPVLIALEDGVLTVTLNRPDKLNAIDYRMMRKLYETLQDAAGDPAVLCVVLTGAGRGFCSGGDLRGATDPDDPIAVRYENDDLWRTPEQKATQVQRFAGSVELLHQMPKPTIAAVNGPAAGAGFCLAAACDFRILSRKAAFTTVFVNSGRSGDFGGSYFLTRLVGPAKARELYMLGAKIGAEEADRIGLATKLAEEDDFAAETAAFARRLAEAPPLALRYIKQNLNAAEHLPLRQVMEMEAVHMMRTSGSADAREAALAARDGRKPKFTGR
ncbi:enoyl-CoA hydratase [Rhodobacterales bacterium HKCCE2091]|nr:enoyl-CoA hydratase [Rhodobacterales bacterium HKCCE2091]